MSTKLDYQPMTDIEKRAALARGKCRLPMFGFTKRFCRDVHSAALAGQGKLTPKMRAHLWRLVYRFRRQIDDRDLLAFAAKYEPEPEIAVVVRQAEQAAKIRSNARAQEALWKIHTGNIVGFPQ